MRMLHEIGVDYHIVLNKFDLVDEKDREKMKAKIESEVQQLELKRVKKIYFVSAKHVTMFPDWLKMVDELTTADAT